MTLSIVILALVSLQRLGELAVARRNTARLLARGGPYRLFPHPNYAVVMGEIAVLPLVFHLPLYAAVFSALNAVVLFVRIRAEGRALAASQAPAAELRPSRSAPASGHNPAPPPGTA